MIVIIPAAGEGKRLADIQPGVPKALKKVAGKPMLYYTIDTILRSFEPIEAVIVVLSPSAVDSFDILFLSSFVKLGNLSIVCQPEPYGTGDAVWRALESLGHAYDGSVLIMYPDVLTNLSIDEFISAGNAVMTKPRGETDSCVYRCPSEPDRVVSVSEKPRRQMGNVKEKLGDWCFVVNAMYLYIACKCLAGLTWEGYEGVVKPEKIRQEFSLTQAIDALMRCGLYFRGVYVEHYHGMGNPEAFRKTEEYLKSVPK